MRLFYLLLFSLIRTLASPKILTLGKTQIYLVFRSLNRIFAHKIQCSGLPLVPSWHERKVRAAQGAPLLKVEAIGDSRCRQKKITAPDSGVRVRRWCKRPPAVG